MSSTRRSTSKEDGRSETDGDAVSAVHWCWAYDDEAELASASSRFLAGGLRRGERVGYFGWGEPRQLEDRLRGLANVETEVARGALLITSLDTYFTHDAWPDPVLRHAMWSNATDAAVRDGFVGFRVVEETAPWMQRREQRDQFLLSEILIDRYALRHPFALMCACARSSIAPDVLAENASLHPSAHAIDQPFRLQATTDGDFALHGEIDFVGASRFGRLVTLAHDGDTTTPLRIDARGLDFIDHRGLLILEREAVQSGAPTVVLRDAPPLVHRLIELLHLAKVRVEASP